MQTDRPMPYLQKAYNHFLAKVEEAKSNPEVEPWDEAIKQGLCWRNNIQYGLERAPLQRFDHLWEILNEYYRDALRSIQDLEWDEEKEDQQLIDLRETIAILPENLPFLPEQVKTTENYEPLLISLWGYIESDDPTQVETFDLGDDGTDEMEQDLELVYHLLHEYQKAVQCDRHSLFTDPIYSIERWIILEELLNESDQPCLGRLSLNHSYNVLLHYVERESWYSESTKWLADFILHEHDIPLTIE